MKHMPKTLLPTISIEAKSIKINSIYEHYKGLKYKILYIALHSEILEELVVYQALYDEFKVWARPLSMFLEDVVIEGQKKLDFIL